MRSGKWLGWLTAAIGLVLTFGPHRLFTVCADHGMHITLQNGAEAPMRCTWTANATQGIGAFILFLGLILIFNKAQGLLRLMSPVVAAAGLLVFLLPLYIVPTCASPKMPCNLETKPTLIGSGLVLLVAAGAAYFVSPKPASSAGA